MTLHVALVDVILVALGGFFSVITTRAFQTLLLATILICVISLGPAGIFWRFGKGFLTVAQIVFSLRVLASVGSASAIFLEPIKLIEEGPTSKGRGLGSTHLGIGWGEGTLNSISYVKEIIFH